LDRRARTKRFRFRVRTRWWVCWIRRWIQSLNVPGIAFQELPDGGPRFAWRSFSHRGKRVQKFFVFFGRADGDANGGRQAHPAHGADDDAAAEKFFADGFGVAAEFDWQEIRERRNKLDG